MKHKKTVNNWISDIRAKQRGTRNNRVYKLDLLGWTQEEIAKVVKITRQRVQQIAKDGNFSKICNYFKSGTPIHKIAGYYGLDLVTSWAIVLAAMVVPALLIAAVYLSWSFVEVLVREFRRGRRKRKKR